MSDEPTGTNIEGDAPVAESVVETDEATITEDAELERTLGLTGGLAIGIGTMIGAGVFVFPGLAGAEVGTAATASFAVGGVIALLVALPTSELATAMPKSGGGYYFISRGLGTLAGTVIGLSLWLGWCSRPRSTSSASGSTRSTGWPRSGSRSARVRECWSRSSPSSPGSDSPY